MVVYKVDRLSRSLLDFARLMALFDRHGVSFVSVTQEFNTTTSLGRLTLNILLSFAQFEREIIGERTRDKLSAARKKGKWIGGIPVLGYDVAAAGGRLLVNAQEAAQVREIFALAEQAPTLAETLRQVEARGLRTKTWTSRGGRPHLGKMFSNSSLSRLLSNVLYTGQISHKGTIYPGEQERIVERGVWEKVNRKLALNGAAQAGRKHAKQEALLARVARCGECGEALVATFTRRNGKRHCYYVCPAAKRRQGCRQRPVAMEDLEVSLKQRLEQRMGRDLNRVVIQESLERLTYASKTRQVMALLRDGERVEYALPAPNRAGARSERPARSGRVPRISRLMALAIKMERLAHDGKVADYAALARCGHVSRARMSQIMNLTNLAPEIQEALLFLPQTMRGRDGITERQLRPITNMVDWSCQKKLFGDLLASASRHP